MEESKQFQVFTSAFHRRSDIHLVRKLWHICFGVSGILIYKEFDYLQQDNRFAYMILAFAAFSFTMEFIRLRFPSMNSFFLKLLGPFMRKSEVNSLSGLPFYALGFGLCLYLYDEQIALLSLLFLAFSDPISSYFGIRYGTDKILPNKSVQGSVAGFCVCYLITLIFGLYYSEPTLGLLFFSLLAGVIGSFSELCSVIIDDNLTIPVISGAGLTFLNIFFQIF